ncbi:MAG: radical SAM protein [Thermoanaerobaculia bacterium]
MTAISPNPKKHRAVLVHVNGMERVIPLAGGYLKAYAMREPDIAEDWNIDLYSEFGETTAASRLIADVCASAADLVGFSVYVWNAGLIRRVLPVLRELMPRASFVLGGTEVINNASTFVDPAWENVIVCNGEGEMTFRDLLRVLPHDKPSFAEVGGISFFRDRELQETPPYPRITSLDDIPSPYLSGYFDRRDYSVALFETNRGCPYKCEFCFWGGAVGQKIHRLSMDRLYEEIEWLGRNKARAVYLCDANFGIFPEDPELARKFVQTKDDTGYPRFVRYSSAKNNPDRALEVATILAQGGVLSVQPLSLQSLNPRALKLAKRDNINLQTYFRLQTRTNELGIASFVELIWPMPGETLASFKQGIQELARMDAQAFSVYPLVWLNNTGYNGREEEYGVITLQCGDASGSSRTVIQTADVSFEEWVEGLMYTNSAQILHGCRGLYHAAAIIEALGVASRQEIFERFRAWMDESSGTELARAWHMGRQKVDEIYSTLSWPGHLVESVLHNRSEFDATLRSFVRANDDLFGGPQAELIAAAVDFDLLARPYVYRNSVLPERIELEVLKIVEVRRRGWLARSPYDIPQIVAELRSGAPLDTTRKETVILFEHDRGQTYRMPGRTQKEYWDECRMFALEMGNHYPTWRVMPQDGLEATASLGSLHVS